MEVAAVIGFAASLGQLIELTSHIFHILNDIKTGGSDRRKLLQEVHNLRSILQQLSSETANSGSRREAWLDIVQSLHDEGGIFDQIKDVMSEIRSRIDRRQGLRLLTQTVFWPFVKEDVERNMKQLNRLYQAVALKLQQAQLSLSRNTDQTVNRIARTTDKRELRAILEWLSPLNFLEQQELEYQRHSTGTCKWFLQSKKFQDWVLSEQQVLFCTAIGGAGKTVLTSVAVDHIRMKTAGQNNGVLMIYCKHDKPETHSVEKLAMALLKQLIQMRTFVPPNLEAILQEHYYNNDTRPKHDDVVKVINTELERFSHSFIFVDGLDEITDDHARRKVIEFIMNFHGAPSVWFTSRPIEVIEEVFITSAHRRLPPGLGRVQLRSDYEESGSEDEDNDVETPRPSDSEDEESEGDTSFERTQVSVMETLDVASGMANTSPADVPPEKDAPAALQRCSMCQNELKTTQRHCKDCQNPSFVACKACCGKGGHCSCPKHENVMRYRAVRVDVSAKPRAIRTFVRRRILDSPELTKWVRRNEWFAAEIESEVTRSARKMFLLAQLHMDAISDPDLLKFSEVRRALETLPNKLHESYDKAMDRVRGHGLSLLRLLCFAERPLSGAEVEHALGITPGSKTLSDDEIIPTNVLISRCAGLVVINGEGALTFSHYTIVGYFGKRRQDLFGNGHALLAQSCLTYLRLSAFDEGPVTEPDEAEAYESRLKDFPFLDYASLFWAHHTLNSNDKELEAQAYTFLLDDCHRNTSVQALWFSFDLEATSWRNRNMASALHLAVFFKYYEFVARLLQQGCEDISGMGDELSPLIWAVQAGDAKIVDLVLNAGTDINCRDVQGNTALHVGILHDHSEVCKLLIIKPDLDINAVQPRGQMSPLMLAAQYGRASVVEQLLGRSDLLLNTRDSDGCTALYLASWSIEIVQLLVRRAGLDIDLADNDGSTALTNAACSGFVRVVKCLLDAGADPNVRQNASAARGTALMRAIDYDQDEVVQELLNRKADWTATDDMDRGILHSAAINGSTYCLRLLLLQLPGLNINAQDTFGNTPLHDAAGLSSSAALQILMDYNARTDIKNNQGKLPLDKARESGFQVNARILQERYAQDFGMPKRIMSGLMPEELTLLTAAAMGREKVVETILMNAEDANDIDLEEQDEWLGRTALQAAIEENHVGIVRRLIAVGANLNHKDKFGRTALHITALRGHTTIARSLLLENAAVNTRDRWSKSPLGDACAFEAWGVAIALIEYGAELNTTDYNLEVLLFAASELGSTKACTLLVQAGVDFQLKDGIGRSPYEIAKQAGNVETAKYLDRLGKSTSQTSIKPLSPAASEISLTPIRKVQSPEEVEQSPAGAVSGGQPEEEIPSIIQEGPVSGGKPAIAFDMNSPYLGVFLAIIALVTGIILGILLGRY